MPTTPRGARCSCGIYVSDAPNIGFSQVDFRGVTGIVTVWGALMREEDGARAQFVRVAALGVYSHWTGRHKQAVKAAARRLEADVVDLQTRSATAPGFRLAHRPDAAPVRVQVSVLHHRMTMPSSRRDRGKSRLASALPPEDGTAAAGQPAPAD